MHTLQQLRRRGRQGLRTVALPLGTALVGAVLTALIFATIGGQAATAQVGQTNELRTERLTLVGPDGAPRAVLGELAVADLQATGLLVYDRDGRTPRVGMGVTTEGTSGMLVLDGSGVPRLQLSAGPQGDDPDGVTITGFDPQGTARFELFYFPTPNGVGTAQVRVYDGTGNVRANMAAFPDGGSVFDLLSQDPHRLRARLGMPPSGQPEVVLFDEAGTVLWRAP